MSPAAERKDGAPDRVLAVRLDALRKNFQQIAKTKAEVEARVQAVNVLHDLATTHDMGVDFRLGEIAFDIATTREQLERLARRLGPGAVERPIDNLQRVADQVIDVRNDFQQMLKIIERMSEGWKQTADDRLKTLDTTLLHESGMRVKKIEKLQRRLQGSAATRADIWDTYEELAYREGETLFGEYVDFIGGLALRNTGLDHGVFQMADDLIGRLYRIGGSEIFHSMTLPTRRVVSRKTIARIIRMGFPEWTVWAVPLGVHEFGHVVINETPELRRLIEETTTEQGWTFVPLELDTYLADAFATCAMGPAYAYATVLLSLDPCREDRVEREDPRPRTCSAASPDSRRAHVILKTLELMTEPTADYEGVRSMLFDDWSDTLGAFGLDFDLGAEAALLDACAKMMWQFLSERSSHLMYKASRYAESAQWSTLLSVDTGTEDAAENGSGSTIGSGRLPSLAPALQELGVRDVLNLAWRERLAEPEIVAGARADRIAAAALALHARLQGAPAPNKTWEQEIRGGHR